MRSLHHFLGLWWNIWRLRLSEWPTRVRAAEKLGALKDSRAVQPLIRALGGLNYTLGADNSSVLQKLETLNPMASSPGEADRYPVRQAAAKALGLIANPQAVPALIAALEDSESKVCQEAAEALGRIRDPKAVPSLAGLLNSHDDDLREKAIGALVQIGPPSINQLIGVLQLSPFYSRQAATKALGLIGDARAVDPLLAALKDPDYSVRRDAVTALANLGAKAEAQLISVLGDPNLEVREAAAITLGKIKDPRAIEPLKTVAQDEEPRVREAAWKALAQIGWPPAHTRERVLRAVAFGDFKKAIAEGASAVEPLAEVFREGDKAVRESVVLALTHIGPAGIESLVLALKDQNRDLRHAVAKVLAVLGWQPAQAAERALLAMATGRYEKAVAEGAAARDLLIVGAKHKDDWDRQMAITSLGELGGPLTLEIIITALDDPVYKVREAAVKALARIGGEAAMCAIKASHNDGHYNVRSAASQALKKLDLS